MNDNTLLKLYEITINEEHFSIKMHQDRVSLYSGFVSTIIAAVVVGFLQASKWYHFIALCVGPVLSFIIAENAIDGCYRDYRRFIETVTIRAKIEQEMGLTERPSRQSQNFDLYWPQEPLIPSRYIKARKMYRSSEEFTQELSKKGLHKVVVRLFRIVQLLSILLFLGMISVAVWMVQHGR